jgi:hypothetical protein
MERSGGVALPLGRARAQTWASAAEVVQQVRALLDGTFADRRDVLAFGNPGWEDARPLIN